MTVDMVPERTEAAEYCFKYIDLVPKGDIRAILGAQLTGTLAFLRGITDEQSRHRYSPDKWSIRHVLTEEHGQTRLTATVLYPSLEVRDGVLNSDMARGASISYDRLGEVARELHR